MGIEKQAVQFLIEGYAVVPAVLGRDELHGIRNAFDALWKANGSTGSLCWDICGNVPEFYNLIGHKELMPLVEAILAVFDDTPAFTHMAVRAVAPSEKLLGMHHDGLPTFRYDFAQRIIATLWYFDPLEEDSGAYIAYVGSHHLSHLLPDGKVAHPKREFVKAHCEARRVIAPAGSVILHRAFNWHDVEPVRRVRRAAYSGYCGRNVYHLQKGHERVTDNQKKMLPRDRWKYIVSKSEISSA